MRRLLAVVLMVLLPLSAWCAGPSQTLEAGQVLRGRFVQERHLKGFNAPLRTEGHFVLVPGRGLIWLAETPFAVTTIITAQGLVQAVGGAETMRLPSARLPFLSRLYDMLGGVLGGDWRAIETDFAATRSGDAGHWQMELSPRQTPDQITMPFRSITAKGGRFLDEVILLKADGGDFDQLRFLDQSLSATPLSADEAAAFDRAR
ncbi:MAG TPA: LolA-related protein [Telmatospirillum sp.]|nr:LolA-related protein [Telmatospirillum sp.]